MMVDLRDYEDQAPHIPPTSTANLVPYACFLKNLPDYSDMTLEEFTKAFEALPLPSPGPSSPGISIHAAVEASNIHQYTDITHISVNTPISHISVSDITHDIIPDMDIRYHIQYCI